MKYLKVARKFLKGKAAYTAEDTISRQRKAFESATLLAGHAIMIVSLVTALLSSLFLSQRARSAREKSGR